MMNKVVFVQKDVFAKPGIMALSAALKSAGFDCRVVVADLERDVVQAVLALRPDVVAFSWKHNPCRERWHRSA